MFEKVSRSLKYDSNIFLDHRHIYIYTDTTVDHFTPLALRVRGNNLYYYSGNKHDSADICLIYSLIVRIEKCK